MYCHQEGNKYQQQIQNNLQILENTPIEDKVSDILSPRKPDEGVINDDPLLTNSASAVKPDEVNPEEVNPEEVNPEEPNTEEVKLDEPVKVEKLGVDSELNDIDLKGIIMGKSPKKNKSIKEITIIKKDEDIPKVDLSNQTDGLGSIGEDSETNVEPIKEFNEEETNKKLDEIITVSVNDDDTETVDNFISDISSLMEKKGVEVEKEVKSYTLFDDASENE